jgi:hypothetical protein
MSKTYVSAALTHDFRASLLTPSNRQSTKTGRARTTIRLLQLNRSDRSEERRLWMTSGLARSALPSHGELPESGRFSYQATKIRPVFP